MQNKRIRRSPDEARGEILRAAQAAIGEGGWSALTVDAVMGRTGMSRPAFYHYFGGLDELAVGLLEEFEAALRAPVDPWLEGRVPAEDPRAAVREHLTAMFEAIEEHRSAVRAVAQAASGDSAVYREWQDRILDHFIPLTARFIRREVERGRSRARDPDRLANALILMNHAVANDNLERDEPDAPAEVAAVLAGIWNASIYGPGD